MYIYPSDSQSEIISRVFIKMRLISKKRVRKSQHFYYSALDDEYVNLDAEF